MPKNFRATALERAIGRVLARWRNDLPLSLAEAGQRVGFSSAKLSTMENAIQPSSPVDIMALGYVYDVPAPEWQAVVLQTQYAATLRSSVRAEQEIFNPAEDLPLLLADATHLRTFTTDAVPTVFQLPGYTAAAAQNDDPLNSGRLARVREAWAKRSGSKDPLPVEAVFPEAVLGQVVGGPRVMKAQLLHLVDVSERPEVSVRVVPQAAGAYPAVGSPFMWLSFPHCQHNDVVYTETFLRCDYVESDQHVEQVRLRFRALWDLALGAGESVELISEAAAGIRC